MTYKMSPYKYFYKVVELYVEARQPKFDNPNIFRGRSSSISSSVEDLTALFIALNNPNDCMYFTDQPIRFEGSTIKYPDIVIQNKDGSINDLVDVKTDIGWNRNGIKEFCDEWENRIEKIRGKDTSFKIGKTKKLREGKFTKNIHYHIIVLSNVNSGKKLLEVNEYVFNNLKNVSLYVLSDGIHPNRYESIENIMNKIEIREKEFKRFLQAIVNKKV